MTAAVDRFDTLAREVGPKVLTYLARRVEPREEAADVYQQVLMTTWRRLPVVPRDHDDALAWMIGVARRTWANQRRLVARRSEATEMLAEHLRAVVGAPEIDLSDALRNLSADDLELMRLVHWDGFNQAEAAHILGISPGAARKRMERARAAARVSLAGNSSGT